MSSKNSQPRINKSKTEIKNYKAFEQILIDTMDYYLIWFKEFLSQDKVYKELSQVDIMRLIQIFHFLTQNDFIDDLPTRMTKSAKGAKCRFSRFLFKLVQNSPEGTKNPFIFKRYDTIECVVKTMIYFVWNVYYAQLGELREDFIKKIMEHPKTHEDKLQKLAMKEIEQDESDLKQIEDEFKHSNSSFGVRVKNNESEDNDLSSDDVDIYDKEVSCLMLIDHVSDYDSFSHTLLNAVSKYEEGKDKVYATFEESPVEQVDIENDVLYKDFDTKKNRPIVEREKYLIKSVDDFKNKLLKAYKSTSFPSKIHVNYNFIKQTKTNLDNADEGDEPSSAYKYSATWSDTLCKLSTVKDQVYASPNKPEQFVADQYKRIIDYVENNVDEGHSNTIFCALYAIEIVKYNIPESGALGEFDPEIKQELKDYIKGYQKSIHACSTYNDDLCVFKALVYFRNDNNLDPITGSLSKSGLKPLTNEKIAHSKATKLWCQFYNESVWVKTRFNWNEEIEKFCHYFKINVIKYDFTTDLSGKSISLISEHVYGYEYTMEVLSKVFKTEDDVYEHIMNVKNIELISPRIVCPYCKIHNYVNNKNNRRKLIQHMKRCNGDVQQQLLDNPNTPYCPIFYDNPLYVYCIVHELEYTPLKYYMVYDFETCETTCSNDIDIKGTLEGTTKEAYLTEFSVALGVYDKKDNPTNTYYCLYDKNDKGELVKNNNFVDNFLRDVELWSKDIVIANLMEFLINIINDYLDLDSIISELSSLFEQKDFIKYLIKHSENALIYGWNSESFDINFILPKINTSDNNKYYLMSDGSHTKQLVITTNEKFNLKDFIKIDLFHYLNKKFGDEVKNKIDSLVDKVDNFEITPKVVFRDAMKLISSCDLRTAAKTYGKNSDDVKGQFPYAKINSDNLIENLLRTTPFEQKDFFNTLSRKDISDEDYNTYLKDFSTCKDFYDYTKKYNSQDINVMYPILNTLIEKNWEDHIDTLTMLSISAISKADKYLSCYEDFDWEFGEYYNKDCFDSEDKYKEWLTSDNKYDKFIMTEGYWSRKVNNYRYQDMKAKRDFSCNITEDDYEYYKDKFAKELCYYCKCHFTKDNPPTLDRIDNSLGHSKSNCRIACEYCNKYCANRDALMTKFFIQLRNYALLNNLPFLIQNKETIKFVRSGLTGGLSIVGHRKAIANESTITRLLYHPGDSDSCVPGYTEVFDTKNKQTNIIGLDFNSLYPSVNSGNEHTCNPYTGHRMYMPGYVKAHFKVNTEGQYKFAYNTIFNSKRFSEDPKDIEKVDLFMVKIKAHIPQNKMQKALFFLPIIRKLNILMDPSVIGSHMYDYLEKNYPELYNKQNKFVEKLTQTFSTHPYTPYERCNKFAESIKNGSFDEESNQYYLPKQNEYMIFSSYYLWFLIDEFDLIIEDISEICTFTKHLAFGNFFNKKMNRRQEAILKGDKVGDATNKVSMNSSYGGDALNSQRFKTARIVNATEAAKSHRSPYHCSTTELNNNSYLVIESKKSYAMRTPLQCSVFTLDNAKYWYLNFIYKFLYKALDLNRIAFFEGDTDSMYFMVAGDPNDSYKQGFKHIIKDYDFYNKNVFKWLPYNFYATDDTYRPNPQTPLDQMHNKKRFLAASVEHQSTSGVAISSKLYAMFGDDNDKYKPQSFATKGVSLNKNPHICIDSYLDCINNQTTIYGNNYSLELKTAETSNILTQAPQKVIDRIENLKLNIEIINGNIRKYDEKIHEIENLIIELSTKLEDSDLEEFDKYEEEISNIKLEISKLIELKQELISELQFYENKYSVVKNKINELESLFEEYENKYIDLIQTNKGKMFVKNSNKKIIPKEELIIPEDKLPVKPIEPVYKKTEYKDNVSLLIELLYSDINIPGFTRRGIHTREDAEEYAWQKEIEWQKREIAYHRKHTVNKNKTDDEIIEEYNLYIYKHNLRVDYETDYDRLEREILHTPEGQEFGKKYGIVKGRMSEEDYYYNEQQEFIRKFEQYKCDLEEYNRKVSDIRDSLYRKQFGSIGCTDELFICKKYDLEKKMKEISSELAYYYEYYNKCPYYYYASNKIKRFYRIKVQKIAISYLYFKLAVIPDNCQTCVPLYLPCNNIIKDLEKYDIDSENLLYNCNDFYENIDINPEFDNLDYDINDLSGAHLILSDLCDDNSHGSAGVEVIKNDCYEYIEDSHVYGFKYSYQLPEYMRYINCDFNKFSYSDKIRDIDYGGTWDFKYDMPSEMIKMTGLSMDVNRSPYVIIDFDINKSLSDEKRKEIREYIIEKYNMKKYVVTTSGGIHYYTTAFGGCPSWYKSRNISCFSEYDKNETLLYDIDLMVPHYSDAKHKLNNTNSITLPGTYAKNKLGEIGQYKLDGDLDSELEDFEEFHKRFIELNGSYIVSYEIKEESYKLPECRELIKNVNKHVYEFVDEEVNIENIIKLSQLNIHRYTEKENLPSMFKIRGYLSHYSNETLLQIKDILCSENSKLTSNAKEMLENFVEDPDLIRGEFGDKYYHKISNTKGNSKIAKIVNANN